MSRHTLFLLLFVAAPVAAQGDMQRRGAWGTFTMGAGSAGVSCGFCDDGREWGPTGALAFGGALSDRVLLGGGATGFARLTETTDHYLGWAYGLVRAYPLAALNAFVTGGVGVAYGQGTSQTDDYSALGAGFVAGLGWDFGLGSGLAVTAVANAHFSAGGYLDQNGVEAASGFNPTLFQFGLGVTLF